MLYELTMALYHALERLAPRCPYYPYEETSLLLDPRFTPSPLYPNENRANTKEDLEQIIDLDGGHAYEFVFHELEELSSLFNVPGMVCTSDDIEEDPTHGEFMYSAGMINAEVGLLFMESTHPWALPSRLILCDQKWQYEVSTDRLPITICPVNTGMLGLLMSSDRKRLTDGITTMLRRSNRPIIYEY